MLNRRKPLLKLGPIVLLGVAMTFIWVEPAFAYADPGSAGLLYQIVIVVFAFAVSYLVFLKDFVKGLFKRNAEDRSDETDR